MHEAAGRIRLMTSIDDPIPSSLVLLSFCSFVLLLLLLGILSLKQIHTIHHVQNSSLGMTKKNAWTA